LCPQVIRQFCFPDYTLRYNGQCVYRTIVSKAEVMKINGIPWAPTFWKHTSGLYVFTCPLWNDDFEVTARIRRPDHDVVSWGRPFDLHTLLHEYHDFCLPIRQVLCLAAEGETQEFALFSGQRLQRIVSHGNIAFIGDASHPMLGNFGAGCGFALEDVYALTMALGWAWSRKRPLPGALELFDSIRSAHYKRLYELMDKYASIKVALREENLPVDEEIGERVKRISLASESWMYYYEIKKVVDEALCGADSFIRNAQATIKSTEQIGVHADSAGEGVKPIMVTEKKTELQA
jgi:salicylate hydroxylase